MSTFCVARLTPHASLLARDGILRAADLGHSADARALAEQIVAQARQQGEALLAEARATAARIAEAAQAAVLAEADALMHGLTGTLENIYDGAEDIVADLVRELYDRLVADTTPAERIAASYRRVLQEAPPRLANAVLRLHPDDMALADDWQWQLRADPALARGACRLEADGGEWQADFNAAAAALAAAFAGGRAVHRPAARPAGEDALAADVSGAGDSSEFAAAANLGGPRDTHR